MMRGFTLLLLLALMAGCNQQQEAVKNVQAEENQASVILEQLLSDKTNLATYRTVVEQLNSYFDYKGDRTQKQLPLSPAQEAVLRQMLSEVKNDFERARRVDDVKNRLFNTLPDASYIDACLLYREAVTSLMNDLGDAPSRNNAEAQAAYQMELAKYLFGWTMRQVANKPNPPGIREWPAHEILRLGAGDAEDRLRVFLGLLGQTDIDAGAVIVKSQVRQDNVIEDRQTPILAAVLINKKVYLFDVGAGKPLAGATPGSIATWDELQKNPSLLGKLADSTTVTQLAQAEIVLINSINSLAPRMESLEKEFDGIKINVKLHDDVSARIARFKDAGITVKPWAAVNRSGFPGTVYQKYVEGSKGDPRLTELVIPRNRLIPDWAREAEAKLSVNTISQRLFNEFDKVFVNLRLEPGGGRDLLVRGKPHQAVERISRLDNRIDRALELFRKDMANTVSYMKNNDLKSLMEWTKDLQESQQLLTTVAKGSKEEQELDLKCRTLFMKIETIWKGTGFRQALSQLGIEWAMPDMREHITYFMALSKMELAIRAEMQYRKNPNAKWPADSPTPAELYTSAAAWFERYLVLIQPTNGNIWLDAVNLRLAECRQKINEFQKQVAAK
jgi:hypothetical protein